MFFKKYTLGAEPKSDFLTLVVNEVAHKEDFFFIQPLKELLPSKDYVWNIFWQEFSSIRIYRTQ